MNYDFLKVYLYFFSYSGLKAFKMFQKVFAFESKRLNVLVCVIVVLLVHFIDLWIFAPC